MADDPEAKATRRRTVPIHPWWTAAVLRELDRRGMTQRALAAAIHAAPPEVSRCISREKPVLELLIAISDELRLPYPVILPETEEIAMELAKQHRLWRRDLQIDEIAAGVREDPPESQPPGVQPEHAVRKRRPRRRTASRVRSG